MEAVLLIFFGKKLLFGNWLTALDRLVVRQREMLLKHTRSLSFDYDDPVAMLLARVTYCLFFNNLESLLVKCGFESIFKLAVPNQIVGYHCNSVRLD